MDKMMRELAHGIMNKIEALEQETDFDYLLHLSDADLRSEAEILYEEIEKLKNLLVEVEKESEDS